MSITKRDLIEDMEPFDDDITLTVRDAQGRVTAVKGASYELHPARDEYVLVLETKHSQRGRRT